MMLKRVFVAINLGTEERNRIQSAVERLRGLESFRFIPPDYWHITLSFLGYQKDDEIVKIIGALKEVTDNFTAPEIIFNKLEYGPPKRARMIWVTANSKASGELQKIKTTFEDKLEEAGISFRRENRPFSAHVTVARTINVLRETVVPALHESIGLSFAPTSLDLMESHLKQSGAEYAIMGKFPFAGLYL